MGALLALASALSYGLSDIAGGVLSRRIPPLRVALLGQVGGLVVAGVAALLTGPSSPRLPDLGWGALSGVGTGLGMAFLFRGMARGAMSIVVPVSAVGGVALPVLVGTVLLGDRPSAPTWLGVAIALPALWLVSRADTADGGPRIGSLRDGLVAGTGIAVQYLTLAQAGPDAGLWPIVAGRVTAVAAVGVLAASGLRADHCHDSDSATRRSLPDAGAAGAGALAAVALTCYLFATRTEFVTVAVVLSSLYPAVPVLFGLTALGERVARRQVAGLVAALVAATLVAAA